MHRLIALALLAPVTALAAPDLTVVSIKEFCQNTYIPRVTIEVYNAGDVASPQYYSWVDVFVNLPVAPSVGELSPVYVNAGAVPAHGSRFVTVDLYSAWATNTWIDVIVDTVQQVPESNEGNNVASAYVNYTNCAIP